MYIIKTEPNKGGGRPPLQKWNALKAPEGYTLCPDEFYEVFYSTHPAGFVNILVSDGMVTEMSINQEAIDNYLANLPEPEVIVPEPTAQDDTDAILVDHEYRLTLLELGV